MTLTLELPPELEQRLVREASQQGLAVEQYTLSLLDSSLPSTQASELASLLASWRAEAPDEQRETGQYLLRILDEDRLSDRKLFPPEGRGVTW